MVVGHNPNLGEFLGRVISDASCEASIELKKGAVAKVEIGRNASYVQWLVTPKLLRTLQTSSAESSRPKSSRK
jgi:phosphohistidine phosphatase SixA